ncbi:MAG: phosphate-starvation-inducible PsiE family protein [Chloroflexi bacterium]|nr:phosphate-starvation-inducible PsiE family protein [Ktedonobacteraceae bacterium]MBV9019126.1 phosphate-starvation-inducible PsiE family protein [Ktedonobacteraceae bacterium]MBV9707398.1 phosphate-starvation-inducible PsiE family protein [Chloroflexota bacterium]
MANYKVGVGEQDSTQPEQSASQAEQTEYERNLQRMQEEERRYIQKDPIAHAAGSILDRTDTFIYAAVGFSFLIGALIALVYTFWNFGTSVFVHGLEPGTLANAIIDFVSGLLLVLIITEVLGTVIHYLKAHETSLRPFLFIGIVSATRSILSVGARLSIAIQPSQIASQNTAQIAAAQQEFVHAMIELAVSAAVIVALGVTLKLLGKLVEIGSFGG